VKHSQRFKDAGTSLINLIMSKCPKHAHDQMLAEVREMKMVYDALRKKHSATLKRMERMRDEI